LVRDKGDEDKSNSQTVRLLEINPFLKNRGCGSSLVPLPDSAAGIHSPQERRKVKARNSQGDGREVRRFIGLSKKIDGISVA
jgi:hypothetical protein